MYHRNSESFWCSKLLTSVILLTLNATFLMALIYQVQITCYLKNIFRLLRNLSIAQKNHTECLSGFEQRTPCFDGPSMYQLFVDDFAQFLVGSTKLTENIEISMKSTPSPLQTKDIHTDFSN